MAPGLLQSLCLDRSAPVVLRPQPKDLSSLATVTVKAERSFAAGCPLGGGRQGCFYHPRYRYASSGVI